MNKVWENDDVTYFISVVQTCFVFWENTFMGETIKLRGLPKDYGTKLYPKGYKWPD